MTSSESLTCKTDMKPVLLMEIHQNRCSYAHATTDLVTTARGIFKGTTWPIAGYIWTDVLA